MPNITVSEEYTDNISEDKDKTLGSEFITRAIPGVKLTYSAPFWVWDVSYKFEYRYYAQNKGKSPDLQNLSAKTHWSLIDEVLFLDISDAYSRVSLDQSRDRTQESLFANQSDQNNFTLSPNMVLKPTSKLILRPGLTYQNTWYKEPTAVDRIIYGANLISEYVLTDKFSFTSNYVFTLTNAQNRQTRNHNALAGIKYEYSKGSFISAQGGFSWVMSALQESNNFLWNVGFNYAGDRVNVRAGTGQTYTNDPTSDKVTLNSNYDLGLDWSFTKGMISLISGVLKVENIPGNSIFSISYNNTATLKYEILPDWEANVSYQYNYIDIRHANTYTTVASVNPAITYSYSNDTKFRLNGKNLHMYSPVILVDNKDINSIMIEVSKTF